MRFSTIFLSSITATPFGGLPMIDYNGFELAQNLTIARYLAKKFDLAGKTPEEEALCDMIVDCTMDVINCDFKSEKFLNETLPNAMKNFAKLLDSNGGKYFVGNCLTWGDIRFASYFEGKFEDEMGKHKCLKDHINNVMNLPNIKAWVAKRPQTQF